jgi:hypothetical protein
MHTLSASSSVAGSCQRSASTDDGMRPGELLEAVAALLGYLPVAAADHDRYAGTAWATAACVALAWLVWIVYRRRRGDPPHNARRSIGWPGLMVWASALLGLTQVVAADADPLALAVVAGLCLQCGKRLGGRERIRRRFRRGIAALSGASFLPARRNRTGQAVVPSRRRRKRRARSGRAPAASRRRYRRARLRRHPSSYPYIRRRRHRPSPGAQADNRQPDRRRSRA